MLQEALAIYRGLGDRSGIAKTLWALAQPEAFGGAVENTRALLDESVALQRELGDRFGLGWALHSSGAEHRRVGEIERAMRQFREALEIFAEARDVSGVTLVLDDIARVNADLGRLDRAIRLAGAAARLSQATGLDLAKLVNEAEGTIETTGRLGPDEIAAAWAEGQAMRFDAAVAYALETLG
jgi:tetratricopeptide (TPR) repeat protein